MASVTKRKWTHKGATKEAWQVRYTDDRGEARCKQFAGKREASAFARQVEGERTAAAAPKTFADLCRDYLPIAARRHQEGRIGVRRLQAITSAFTTRVGPHFGTKLAEAITPADIDDYQDALLAGGTLNPRSARVQLEYLRLVEDEANKRGHLLARPVSAAMRAQRSIERDPIRTFTVDEVKRLVAHAPLHRPNAHAFVTARLACFVNVAAFCGLRRGEIAGLTVANIKFAERVIEVRHSLTERRELKGPKTKAGRRDVPLPPHVATMLREWIDVHHVSGPSGLLFTDRRGGAMNPNAINEVWPGLLSRAGLAHHDRPFHFHALRHFYASMMIEAGTPLADAAILLGHSSFDETLQTYAHSVVRAPARHAFADRMVERFGAGLPPVPSLPPGGPRRTPMGANPTATGAI